MPDITSRTPWTDKQLEQLRERYPHEQTELIAAAVGHPVTSTYGMAAKLGLKKSAEYLASPAAGRLASGANVGSAHRFEPGQTPWNKGAKFSPGGRCAETQFKPGQRPHTWKPIGSERTNRDGYLQRKMTDTGYPPDDWVGVHILTWEKHHGPVPAKHAVVFRDGDKANIEIDNLECISRADLMRRNSVHNLPKELAELVQLRGALNRQINQKEAP